MITWASCNDGFGFHAGFGRRTSEAKRVSLGMRRSSTSIPGLRSDRLRNAPGRIPEIDAAAAEAGFTASRTGDALG